MVTIYRNSYTVKGQKRFHKRWYIKYRDPTGQIRRVAGFADREATERLARSLERPSLADALPAYIAFLRAKGTSDKHRKVVDSRIRCFDLSNLSGSSVLASLPTNRQTAKHYLSALKSFIRWAINERIIATNPISHLTISLKSYKPTFMRRSLTRQEIEDILTTDSRKFRGLRPPQRVMLYRTALNTGFRAKELASLTPAHLTPSGLILLSTDSKNAKETVQPLSPSFHAALSAYTAHLPSKALIWPGSWWQRANDMLQRDYLCDADFHCLRVTYITELVRMGFYPKQVQILARHSTMELTMRYYAKLTPSDFNLTGLWQ